ncbi:glucosamine/galactosamine-6-phosphate isomerase [Isosphaera pallida ATCC 43644]|uniref:Glucosamine/galactosamine-6-phosphate isomerase n=1 Tax=Isosphaera pallida (strain ATCC 43644 / DSM 9630 / IS1B) TaxID=575540 RepID=E8QZG0_ISOPI|nr:6-phosphogluconolactonase [Isosphaera pallida]ADV61087.1 glucosamine/galactosamine-6-phosphate isomerase [Isosphaera pallida ATCC 43644]
MSPPPSPIKSWTVDALTIEVYNDRAALGRAGAARAAQAMRQALASRGVARVVFAAAPSQNELLDALVDQEAKELDWSQVMAFHMDEYLGIAPDHPASFRRYLRTRLFDRVGIGSALGGPRLIPGERTDDPLAVCLDYAHALSERPLDLVCAGIGENGHLAFNDPPVADFLDPVAVKTVRLDHACRVQQVNDGCFANLSEVPTHAYTLTIPTLLSASTLVVAVPGPRKADAVAHTLRDPIAEACPATALRRHAGATLLLDRDSARLVLE